MDRRKANGILKEVLASIAASLGFFIAGLGRGYTSPGIPSMNEDEHGIKLTEEEASWISSIPPLAAFFGSFMAGPLLYYFGRRRSLILLTFPFIIGWLLLGFAKNVLMVYASRIVTGICFGICPPAAQIYISECASAHVRGALGSIPPLAMSLGILATYVLGAFLKWDHLAFVCTAFPILLLIGLSLVPESPAWLVAHGHREKAVKALCWLRGGTKEDVIQELDDLQTYVDASAAGSSVSMGDIFSAWHPLLISLSLMFFQQACGVNAVIFYTVNIFHSADAFLEEHIATIIVGIVLVIGTFLGLILVDRTGRKTLLAVSGGGMAVSLFALAGFYYVKDGHGPPSLEYAVNHEDPRVCWLPLASLVLYMLFYSIGFNSAPYVIMGELFPAKVRNILGSIATAFLLILTFIVLKTFPTLKVELGYHGVFWIYSAFSAASVVFVMVFLPETKGQTLEEIETIFSKVSKDMKMNKNGSTNYGGTGQQNTGIIITHL